MAYQKELTPSAGQSGNPALGIDLWDPSLNVFLTSRVILEGLCDSSPINGDYYALCYWEDEMRVSSTELGTYKRAQQMEGLTSGRHF